MMMARRSYYLGHNFVDSEKVKTYSRVDIRRCKSLFGLNPNFKKNHILLNFLESPRYLLLNDQIKDKIEYRDYDVSNYNSGSSHIDYRRNNKRQRRTKENISQWTFGVS